MSNWQPIETAPKGPAGVYDRGPEILAARGTIRCVARWFWHANGKTGNWKSGGYVVSPTHWQPLPEPPEAGQ